MDFNIAYLGPEALYHLRRDFILGLKYGLEDLGHRVSLGGAKLHRGRLNFVIGAYFLPTSQLHALANSEIRIAHINTEIIADDMLNHNPEKVDFLGAYLPAMQSGEFIWDAVPDNMQEHQRYACNAHFLKWGWHPRIEDIEHYNEKDLDFYFFGFISKRRWEIIDSLINAGLTGKADHSCPYFQRNDAIARSKVQINIVQDDKYNHVNSMRICYLANNRCALVSEPENDPAGYLGLARIASKNELPEAVRYLAHSNAWRDLGESIYADYRSKPSLKENLECLLELSFSSKSGAPTYQFRLPEEALDNSTRSEPSKTSPGLLRRLARELFKRH